MWIGRGLLFKRTEQRLFKNSILTDLFGIPNVVALFSVIEWGIESQKYFVASLVVHLTKHLRPSIIQMYDTNYVLLTLNTNHQGKPNGFSYK
jgi:hypothetical protein